MLAIIWFAGLVAAQFPPKPEGVRVLKSHFHEGVRVSYKEPGICETTPGVKSYAGYVHLPVDALNEAHEHNGYPINTFYWFFESRKDPKNAPLAIWLNGGPGGSSLLGALSENGPCFISNDSKSTYINPWSWNNEVNMLFIDQPNQVGYSYDILTNITTNLTPYDWEPATFPANFSHGVPQQNHTFLVGTAGSQDYNKTANSTQHAAAALWHFAQTWFEEFPHYKPHDEQISLFTESYGGHYGPGFMEYFLRQNELIDNGTITGPGVHYLHLNTLGIINGCMNAPDMFESLLTFVRNNTYGIHVINQTTYDFTLDEYYRKGGALDQLVECRRLALTTDPQDHGDVAHTNEVCASAGNALENVTNYIFVQQEAAARFDITHELQDPFPPPYVFGYLNQAEVQAALGVPVNHTWASNAVASAFDLTGDIVKGGQVEQMAHLLSRGVKVALFHGDRDYACNWVGGEKTSLRIPWKYQEEFGAAGYASLALSEPYLQSGGLVRQFGNLSFTRVYQAGHMVPSYQPEAAYRIFMRALLGKDIATGEIDLAEYRASTGKQYKTSGPSDTWWMKSDVLPQPAHECYAPVAQDRCSEEEQGWLRDGSAVVKDWILIGHDDSKKKSHNDDVARLTSAAEQEQIPLA